MVFKKRNNYSSIKNLGLERHTFHSHLNEKKYSRFRVHTSRAFKQFDTPRTGCVCVCVVFCQAEDFERCV